MPVTAAFFARLRAPTAARAPLFEVFTQQQVNSLNTITAVFDAFKGHDHCPDDLAYVMATAYWECGHGLNLAIEEIGRGRNKGYGLPAGPYGNVYYGRGPCQETWLANYQKAKLRSNIDFVQFPEYMCDPTKSVVDMIAAMYAGAFTGKGLRTYIIPNNKPTGLAAFVECRRIINGTDHAAEIAEIAVAFQAALSVGYALPVSAHVMPQPPAHSTFLSFLLSLFGVHKS